MAPHSQFGKGARPHSFVHGRMESPNTSMQAILPNPSCLGQAHSNRPGTGPGYEKRGAWMFLTVLRVPSTIRPMRNADAKFGKVV